ncbi:MAG: tetratricopeptide repeat protein [Burkholderiaceae bacterium]
MQHDLTGLSLSSRQPGVAGALDALCHAYVRNGIELPVRLKALIDTDPDYGFAHTLRAAFTLAGSRQADAPVVAEALQKARALACAGNERERAHLAAVQAYAGGDPLLAVRRWADICAHWPTDVFAYRFHHFVAFWLGRPEAMLALARQSLPHWRHEWPVYGPLLACQAFAHEECGLFLAAENYGRRAVELDPGEPWGAHAVAHVIEMQQRHHEGIVWLDSLSANWHDRNNLRHHLWWHLALYHFELGDDARVLELYDRGFRDRGSPLTQAVPDLYIDQQNAVSMLVRLELQGIDVGDRWHELGELALARIGDCTNLFSVPHYLLALLATGRKTEAGAMAEAVRAFAEGGGAGADRVGADQRQSAREALVPVCEAILDRDRGDFDSACDHLRAALGGAFRLGGSHAQQDLFGQLAADCALRADRQDLAALLATRLAGRYGWSLAGRRGYRVLA